MTSTVDCMLTAHGDGPLTVTRGSLSHTRAFLTQPSPLHLNTVAGELLDLLPALRQQHVALRL